MKARQLFRQDCEAVYCSLVVQHPLGAIAVQKRQIYTNSRNDRVTDPPKPRVRVMWHFAVVSMGVSNEPCECLTYSRSFSAAVFTNWIKKILCQVDTWNPGWMKLRLSWISSAPHTVTWMVNVFVHACSLVLMLQLGILPSKHLNHKQISGTYRSLLVMFASCFM